MKNNIDGLFVYGTLKNLKIQNLLFKEKIKSYDAILPKHFIDDSQEYFDVIESNNNNFIKGKFLKLNKNQLLAADQWESVPIYTKKIVKIKIYNNNEIYSYIYKKMKPSSSPHKLVNMNILSNCENSENEVEILTKYKDYSIPISDMFLICNINIEQPNLLKNNNSPFSQKIITKIKDIQKFKKYDLIIDMGLNYISLKSCNYLKSASNFILLIKSNTNQGKLIITFPVSIFNPNKLFENFSNNTLQVNNNLNLNCFLKKFKLYNLSNKKLIIFTSSQLKNKNFFNNDIIIYDEIDFHPIITNRIKNQILKISTFC